MTGSALMSRTRYEWTLLDYAIWAVGAVTVPIYETSSAEQAAWILEDSGAVAVRGRDRGARRPWSPRPATGCPTLGHVWQIDRRRGRRAGRPRPAVELAEVERRRAAVGADDLATIIYTSGTTGRPKGCVLTHRNMYADIANAIPGCSNLFHDGARTLLFLPLAHSFAR